jgi:hypothetical protein
MKVARSKLMRAVCSLLNAGLVDRFRVVVSPVITRGNRRLTVQFEDQALLHEQGGTLTFPGYTRHRSNNPDPAETAPVRRVLSRALSGTAARVRS